MLAFGVEPTMTPSPPKLLMKLSLILIVIINMIGDHLCNYYRGKVKPITQSLRDCSSIRHICLNLANKAYKTVFFNTNVHDWIHLNMTPTSIGTLTCSGRKYGPLLPTASDCGVTSDTSMINSSCLLIPFQMYGSCCTSISFVMR